MPSHALDPGVDRRTSALHLTGLWLGRLGSALLAAGGLLLIIAAVGLIWEVVTGDDDVAIRIIVGIFGAVTLWLIAAAVTAVNRSSPGTRVIFALLACGLAVALPWPWIWEGPGLLLVALAIALGLTASGETLTSKYRNLEIEQKRLSEELARYGSQAEWARRHLGDSSAVAGHTDFARDAQDLEEIGVPGEGLYGVIDVEMDRSSALSGTRGEISTSEAIRSVACNFPGATLMNGLRVPGSTSWDIDHALVYANLVIFIDSKNYSPGPYAWVGDSLERLPPAGNRRRSNSMKTAVGRIFPLLPAGVAVESIIVIHDNRNSNGIVIVGDPAAGNRPRLFTRDQFVYWLATALEFHSPGDGGPLTGVSARRHQDIVNALFPVLPPYIAQRHGNVPR